MLKLKVEKREIIGKKVKKLRRDNIIPATLYGAKIKPKSIQVKYKDFVSLYEKAGESTLINLDSKNFKKQIPVLIHNMQLDPVEDRIIHIDFLAVQVDKPIKASVSLEFIGTSKAVLEQEGTLVKNINEVEIQALPLDLPHEIKVDISKLETFEDRITIADIEIPKEVEIFENKEKIIAIAIPPRTQEEMEKLEEKLEEELPEDVKEEDAEQTEESEEQEKEPAQEQPRQE